MIRRAESGALSLITMKARQLIPLTLGLLLSCAQEGSQALPSPSSSTSSSAPTTPGVYEGPIFPASIAVEQKLVEPVGGVLCSGKREGPCDPVYCEPACSSSSSNDTATCIPVCSQKACEKLPVDKCPSGLCILRQTCSGVGCAQALNEPPLVCGPHGYLGTLVECCAGLVRRCGLDQGDGTCKHSNGYVMCLTCGNGECDSLENSCNCPEDCGAPTQR